MPVQQTSTVTWPFPAYPAKPWSNKQIKEYEANQRKQAEDALM